MKDPRPPTAPDGPVAVGLDAILAGITISARSGTALRGPVDTLINVRRAEDGLVRLRTAYQLPAGSRPAECPPSSATT